jgi:tetratricopeptide (TPR) repeat protein/TolB-like protein
VARAAILLASTLVCTLSCSKSSPPAVRRIAVVRFENLTGDDSLNWMGRAASEVVSAELAGSGNTYVIPYGTLRALGRVLGSRPAAAPGISAERPAAMVAGASHIVYGRISRRGGELELDATLGESGNLKTERSVRVAGPASRGIIPLADSLVRQMTDTARPFETQNDLALREYSAGIEASDPQAAGQAFSRAVAADPNFGSAYAAWAELTNAQGNKAEAERIVALARARGTAVTELVRAQLDAIDAGLRGDFKAGAQALEKVGRLNPNDLGLFRQLAQANLNARRYRAAAENLRRAAALEANDPVLYNQLGYAEMYDGNLSEALKAIEQYARLRPEDPNALDSLGDVNFYLGHLAEAEKYYKQGAAKDPNFLAGAEFLKAAHARLMTGDVTGAEGLFNEYLKGRQTAKDPLVEYRRAGWEYLTGHRRPAIARMETFARTAAPTLSPDIAATAYCQLAIWSLELGDRTRARDFAVKSSSGKVTTGAAQIALFLTESVSGGDAWSSRADRVFPLPAQQRTKQGALAYALLFAQDFPGAVPLLLNSYEHSAPDPQETLPVLLAWAQIKSGNFDDAARLVAHNPVPTAGGSDLFTSLAFPRLLFLRAELAARQNKREEAERNYRLFLALSGPDAQIFGEEQRAREALQR